jgi:4-diphosphocytidyl-2-C-methyl-D-erythritol kinase
VQALHDVPAPAKLNLFLHVVGRRKDGYHLLQSVFRFVDLCDLLHFERTADGRILREGEGLAGLAQEDDLVVRAAQALQAATGVGYGVRIRYEKRIPAGGGLGGGSSDAASTLIALNRLWETRLRRAQLLRLAVSLGADVPVFVFGQSAFAQGIGEDLTPVVLPDRAYWIVQPRVQVPTARIFADPDLTRDSESVKIAVFTDWQTGQPGLFGRNDLEAVVFRHYPAVSCVARAMRDAGLEVRMTGSGACLFASFENLVDARLQRDRIISKISSLPDGAVGGSWVCQGLADHPLRGWIVD